MKFLNLFSTPLPFAFSLSLSMEILRGNITYLNQLQHNLCSQMQETMSTFSSGPELGRSILLMKSGNGGKN